MSQRVRVIMNRLRHFGSAEVSKRLSVLTGLSLACFIISTVAYVATIPSIVGGSSASPDFQGSTLTQNRDDNTSAELPSSVKVTQDARDASSNDSESPQEESATTADPVRMTVPASAAQPIKTPNDSSTTDSKKKATANSNTATSASSTSSSGQNQTSKQDNGQKASSTNGSTTSANSKKSTTAQPDADSDSNDAHKLTDEELQPTLANQYATLSIYASQANECTEAFNEHCLDSSVSKRKKYRNTCDTLANKILRSNPAVRNILVPADSKYLECHNSLVGAYRTLWQYTSTLTEAWDENIKYDDPSRHIDDFMEPLTYESVSGKCKYLAEFENYYKRAKP